MSEAWTLPAGLDQFWPAMLAAQAAIGELPKRRMAEITTRSGSPYRYAYADLADLLAVIRPALIAEQIVIMQPIDCQASGQVQVRTLLVHTSSGQSIISPPFERLFQGADHRELGALTTYMRRYSLLSFLGLQPSGEDEDGAPAAAARRSERPARPPVDTVAQRAALLKTLEATAKRGTAALTRTWQNFNAEQRAMFGEEEQQRLRDIAVQHEVQTAEQA